MPDQPGQRPGGKRELIHGVPNIALIAGGVAFAAILLLFMFKRVSAGSQPNAQAQSAMQPGASTGSNQPNILPLPYPVPGTPSGTTPTQASGLGKVTLGPAPGLPNQGVWSTSVATGTSPGGPGPIIPFGTYSMSEAPVSQGGTTYWPIYGPGGAKLYALGENVLRYNQPSSAQVGQQVYAG